MRINVPDNLNDIKLEQYQKLLLPENDNPERYLSILLNVNNVDNFKGFDVERYLEKFTNIFKEETPLQMRFTMNGVEYGMIPNLDEITYGENKDLTKYINDWATMHRAMAVLFRPIIKKSFDSYLIEPYAGTAKTSEKMKEMPIAVVFGAIVFFWNLTKDLSNCILNYIKSDVELKQHLQKNGVVIENLMSLPEETFSDTKLLRNFPSILA